MRRVRKNLLQVPICAAASFASVKVGSSTHCSRCRNWHNLPAGAGHPARSWRGIGNVMISSGASCHFIARKRARDFPGAVCNLSSSRSSSTTVTTVRSVTKRARSSTCPSVSSPSMPSPSHRISLHAEIIAQSLFDLSAASVGIAVWIKQTRFGSEQGAGAVHIDRAAFQNHVRIENRQSPSFSATRVGTTSSRSQGGYLPPQAL